MVTAKAWKADAILRLLLSVIICGYAGSLLMSAVHYASSGGKTNPKLFYALAAIALGCLVATLILISKPWRLETFTQRMAALVICAYGGLFLGFWVQRLSGATGEEVSVWRVSIATLSLQGAALVLVARFLREHQTSWAEGFGFLNHRCQAGLLGLLATVIFLPLGGALQYASAMVITHLPYFKMEPQEQLAIQALRVSVYWEGRLAFGAAAVLLVPVAEETLFRGILYPAIKQAGHPRLALWGTAVLFAAIHMNLATFLPLAVLALVLTVLYERTNNLLAPITAHMLFNAFNLARLLFSQQVGAL